MGGLLRSVSSSLGGQLLSPQKRASRPCQGVPAVPEEPPQCAHTCVHACLLLLLCMAT